MVHALDPKVSCTPSPVSGLDDYDATFTVDITTRASLTHTVFVRLAAAEASSPPATTLRHAAAITRNRGEWPGGGPASGQAKHRPEARNTRCMALSHKPAPLAWARGADIIDQMLRKVAAR